MEPSSTPWESCKLSRFREPSACLRVQRRSAPFSTRHNLHPGPGAGQLVGHCLDRQVDSSLGWTLVGTKDTKRSGAHACEPVSCRDPHVHERGQGAEASSRKTGTSCSQVFGKDVYKHVEGPESYRPPLRSERLLSSRQCFARRGSISPGCEGEGKRKRESTV